MKHPVMQIGKFEFHYVQVPFDDRYIVVKHNGNDFAKWKKNKVPLLNEIVNFAAVQTDECWSSRREGQINTFSNKIVRYDKYLDSMDR